MLSFTVYGTPKPRGSKIASLIPRRGGGFVKRNGRPVLVARDSCKESQHWMSAVAAAAREAMEGGELASCSVVLSARFFFARPKSHYGSGKNAHKLKDNAPVYHTQKPDVDKLLRAVLDSCTGQVWRDDAQVYWLWNVSKHWTCENARADIEIDLE